MPNTGSSMPRVDLEGKSSAPVSAPELKETARWNTKNLGLRLASDAVAGFSAAFLVAPIIANIDKYVLPLHDRIVANHCRAIMQNASGQATIRQSLTQSIAQFVTRPHQFFTSKPFCLILMLYGGTYFTANTLDTATSTMQDKPATMVTKGPSKFIASSVANVSLTLYKDRTYVKLFGAGGPARPVPFPCYLLFATRDCLTIAASFNIPPVLGPVINDKLGDEMRKYVSGASIAQFVTPATVQLFSTPLHLLGLDLYNRTERRITWTDRWNIVRKNWAASTVARMCRIIPAFGFGGVVNMRVREGLISKLE